MAAQGGQGPRERDLSRGPVLPLEPGGRLPALRARLHHPGPPQALLLRRHGGGPGPRTGPLQRHRGRLRVRGPDLGRPGAPRLRPRAPAAQGRGATAAALAGVRRERDPGAAPRVAASRGLRGARGRARGVGARRARAERPQRGGLRAQGGDPRPGHPVHARAAGHRHRRPGLAVGEPVLGRPAGGSRAARLPRLRGGPLARQRPGRRGAHPRPHPRDLRAAPRGAPHHGRRDRGLGRPPARRRLHPGRLLRRHARQDPRGGGGPPQVPVPPGRVPDADGDAAALRRRGERARGPGLRAAVHRGGHARGPAQDAPQDAALPHPQGPRRLRGPPGGQGLAPRPARRPGEGHREPRLDLRAGGPARHAPTRPRADAEGAPARHGERGLLPHGRLEEPGPPQRLPRRRDVASSSPGRGRSSPTATSCC